MGRPRSIDNEALLTSARKIFLEQGYSATTSSIARRAGVSEGTLFKRFSTKDELFAAALGVSHYGQWRQQLVTAAGTGDVRGNLERAVRAMFGEAVPLIGSLVATFSRGIDPSHNPLLMQLDQLVQADRQALATYLGAEQAAGRLRPADPAMTALVLHSALTSFLQHRHFPVRHASQPPETQPPEPDTFLALLLDLCLGGLSP